MRRKTGSEKKKQIEKRGPWPEKFEKPWLTLSAYESESVIRDRHPRQFLLFEVLCKKSLRQRKSFFSKNDENRTNFCRQGRKRSPPGRARGRLCPVSVRSARPSPFAPFPAADESNREACRPACNHVIEVAVERSRLSSTLKPTHRKICPRCTERTSRCRIWYARKACEVRVHERRCASR